MITGELFAHQIIGYGLTGLLLTFSILAVTL